MWHKAPSFWQTRGFLAHLFWPVSIVYYLLMLCDRMMKGVKVYRPLIPVISVGNLVVGGSGKTPVVAFLAKYYADKGHKVAILSRGYGSKIKTSHRVTAQGTALVAGDEPLMLFQQLQGSDVQIWVGADRRESARQAEKNGATLIILDDGMQHWLLARDADIMVTNAGQGFGNKFLLPAGPLREPVSAAARVDAIVEINGTSAGKNFAAKTVLNTQDVQALKDKSVVAFCGIGVPDRFFTDLKKAGVNVVEEISFPDHFLYTEDVLQNLRQIAREHKAVLATTQKDAVKLPESFSCQAVKMALTIEHMDKLAALIGGKIAHVDVADVA